MLPLLPLLLPSNSARNTSRGHRFLKMLPLAVIACAVCVSIAGEIRSAVRQAEVKAEEQARKLHEYKVSDAVSALVAARQQRIKKDIALLPNHEWAGRYYHGDGLGLNITLDLAPESGFIFRSAGCMGLIDQNYGTVDEGKSRFKLQFALPNDNKASYFGIQAELVPVRWGKRHYLIGANELVKFCNAVNDGDSFSGRSVCFLLRDGDERKTADGLPDVPPAYRRYLLAHPVSASILWVQPEPMAIPFMRPRPSRDVTVLLNVGSADGILPGMEFHPDSADYELGFESAEVNQVDTHTCRATFSGWDRKKVIPAKGWTLSTQYRFVKDFQINSRNHREF